jgi:hypothetical protein
MLHNHTGGLHRVLAGLVRQQTRVQPFSKSSLNRPGNGFDGPQMKHDHADSSD